MAASFTYFPSSRCPFVVARYAQRSSCRFGAAPARWREGSTPPARRRRDAHHCSSSVRSQKFVQYEPGLHMYIFTRLSTNERRSGAPGLRSRDSSSEFSTALAGGRGVASASTASRSQAPRGGSSAPRVWSRPSSACPRRVPIAPRRSLRTVAASRGVSSFGSRSVACEGGIEPRVRARGVGRSSGRAGKVCRLGGARPALQHILLPWACLPPVSAAERQKRCVAAGHH